MNHRAISHIPVLLAAVIQHLVVKAEGIYVDATLGDGGHAQGILEATSDAARLIGIDRDTEALQRAGERLAAFAPRLTLIHGNFGEIRDLLRNHGVEQVDGLLLDLGVSSMQLDRADRGFSFQQEGPLDMRQDRSKSLTAFEIVNHWPVAELARIFSEYGEERWARKIARAIDKARKEGEITTTTHLARIISLAIPRHFYPRHIHPATRVFQALRFAVNAELEGLDQALLQMISVLAKGGRVGVISYESLSDRLVKRGFKRLSGVCTCPPEIPQCLCGRRAYLRIITPKPIQPNAEEIAQNPRARSARLRVAERINENEN